MLLLAFTDKHTFAKPHQDGGQGGNTQVDCCCPAIENSIAAFRAGVAGKTGQRVGLKFRGQQELHLSVRVAFGWPFRHLHRSWWIAVFAFAV